MKTCPYCGAHLPDTANFCGICGKKQDSIQPQVRGANNTSYGWPMPQEENEFTYHGDWRDYFRSIFRETYPGYEITEKETVSNHPLNGRSGGQMLGKVKLPALSSYPSFNSSNLNILSEIYTFHKGDAVCLVVEVRTGESTAGNKAAKKSCETIGIPYVRFYYDHPGWWNTRSYVKERIIAAMKP